MSATLPVRDQYFACCKDIATNPPKCVKLIEDDFFIFQYDGDKPYYFKFDMQHKGGKSFAQSYARYEGKFHHATPVTRYSRCKYHVQNGYCTMQFENGTTTFTYANRVEIFTFSAPKDGVIVNHTITYKPKEKVVTPQADASSSAPQ